MTGRELKKKLDQMTEEELDWEVEAYSIIKHVVFRIEVCTAYKPGFSFTIQGETVPVILLS